MSLWVTESSPGGKAADWGMGLRGQVTKACSRNCSDEEDEGAVLSHAGYCRVVGNLSLI